MDLDSIADDWARAQARQAPTQPAPAAPPPVQQAAPQQQTPPGLMRQTPDGGLIGADFELAWVDGSVQGDPNSRVALHHRSGRVLYDGPYGGLLTKVLHGVWVPAAFLGAQQPQQQPAYYEQQLAGPPEPQHPPAVVAPDPKGGRRAALGTFLALLAGGVAVFAGAKVLGHMKEDAPWV